MKKLLCLSLTLILSCLSLAGAAGFCSDVSAINEACLSVMKLDVKNDKGVSIATASGFIAFDDRTLITNCHVIENAFSITALSDKGQEYPITQVLCADSDRDIAILLFSEPTGLAPLTLGADVKVYRASPVVAIGSPQGFANNVSKGNVSSVYTNEEGVRLIQFNAAISAGSSGGALMNDDGLVVGVTTGSYTRAQNMNEAVSISEAVDLYEAHKDGTPAPLDSWLEVNQGVKEVAFTLPAARSFTVKNSATFSISEVYLYPDGAASWGKARNTSGWLYKGSEMEFTVTDDEAKLNSLWTLNFCFYYNQRPVYMESRGIRLSDILGKTVVITIENGNTIHVDIEEA